MPPDKKMGKRKEAQINLHDFYHSINDAYLHILSLKPDLIVVPMRGGLPLYRSVRLLASLDRSSSRLGKVLLMPSGTRTSTRGILKMQGKKLSEEQEKTLPPNLGNLRKTWKGSEEELFSPIIEKNLRSFSKPPRVVLLDETISGGTISTMHDIIEKALQKIHPTGQVFSVSIAQKGLKTSRRFNELKDQGKLEEFTVPQMFTTDNAEFLYQLTPEGKVAYIPHVQGNIMTILEKLGKIHENMKREEKNT